MPTPATRGAATAFRAASLSGIWGSEGGFRPIADVADALSPSGERYEGLAACCLAAVERGWTTYPSPNPLPRTSEGYRAAPPQIARHSAKPRFRVRGLSAAITWPTWRIARARRACPQLRKIGE